MPIPAGVETVTISDGGVPITGPDGGVLDGFFTVTGPDIAVVAEDDFLFGGFVRRWVEAGRFDDLTLVATDATNINPSGFAYTIAFTPRFGTPWTRYFQLPKATPSVLLTDILRPDQVTGVYIPVVGPQGPPGPKGDTGATGPQPPLGDAGAGPAIALRSDDPTTSDARTPTAHAPTHATAGSDPLSPGSIGALPASGGSVTGPLFVSGNALGEDTAAAHGAAAWAYDPALAVNSTGLDSGRLYLVRVNLAAAVNVTRLYWWTANTGSGAVAGQNFVGLYDSDGTLLAAANVDAAISTATLQTTVVPAQPLAAGSFCWVGLLFNATIPPTLTRASGWTGVGAAANFGLTPATYRFAVNGTGRTAMPPTLDPALNAATDFAGPWVAVGS